MARAILLSAGMILLASLEVQGIRDKDNQGRWEKRVQNGPDAEVPGFLVNLGPTGARAVLTEKTFVVKHVFKGSPAYERLRINDVITGAFGKPFASHTFGGAPHGYEGPIMDLGDAIERAEGKDGRLILNVARGAPMEEVTIPLEAIGTFSCSTRRARSSCRPNRPISAPARMHGRLDAASMARTSPIASSRAAGSLGSSRIQEGWDEDGSGAWTMSRGISR